MLLQQLFFNRINNNKKLLSTVVLHAIILLQFNKFKTATFHIQFIIGWLSLTML